jgi:hypothetical protein
LNVLGAMELRIIGRVQRGERETHDAANNRRLEPSGG